MDLFCGFRAQTSACVQCPQFGDGCDYKGLREAIEEIIELSQKKKNLQVLHQFV